MVATSKLKRAQDRVAAARPYAERLGDVVRRLINPELAQRYPLLRQPARCAARRCCCSPRNRGLAGAFNANLIRQARNLLARAARARAPRPSCTWRARRASRSSASRARSWARR